MTTARKLELGADPTICWFIRVLKIDPPDCYYYDRGIRLCNKTGTTSFVRADIGVIMSARRRMADASLASWERDTGHRNAVLDVMRRASGLVGEHVGNV